MEPSLLAALLLGLAGGGHCIGMCGGISAALSLGVPKGRRALLYSLGFNLGRILSYAFIGALVGFASQTLQLNQYLNLSLWLAGTMLVLMGLSIGQWWQGVRKIEQLGQYIWRWLSPLTKSLLPIKSVVHALALGGLWGWLPCGLIYSSLIWASSAGDWHSSSMLMLAFGIGTLPANLATGLLAQQLRALLSQPMSQRLLGASLMGLGLYTMPVWS
ncbi:MAG: sulfite exporter TauE/SafE family protein [Gammaproteobacteria bacterium]|nr:sulfite exporter TauE/SafE family protein [Gammaproteobacteria bacterium]